MILVDANILLYAYHPRAEQHEFCRRWLEEFFSGPAPVHLAWITILAFLRIGTSARVFERLNNPLLEKFQISHVNFSPEYGGISTPH